MQHFIVKGLISAYFFFVVSTPSESILSLADCIDITLKKSPYSQQIKSNQNQASASVSSTISTLLPQLSFASDYIRNGPANRTGSIVNPNLPVSSVQDAPNSYQSNITINQSVFNPSQWLGVKQAIYNRNAVNYSSRASIADLIFNVKQAYYSLIQSYLSQTVSEAALSQNQEQVIIARERYRLGVINRPDLLQVETAYLQSQTSLLESRAQVNTAHQKLARIIGLKESFAIDTSLVFPDTSRPLPSIDSLVDKLSSVNPSFLAAKQTLLADKVYRIRTKWNTAPILNFQFTYGYSSSSFGFSNWTDHYFFNANLHFVWNLYSGGSNLAQLRQLSAQISSSEASEKIAFLSALEQLYQAYGNLKATNQELSLIKPLITQSTESYTLMLEKFRLGAASSTDLLSSQLSFVQSTQKANSILVNYYTAQADVMRILGKW